MSRMNTSQFLSWSDGYTEPPKPDSWTQHLASLQITTKPEPPTIPANFHPFPTLPVELRLKIWQTALSAPRTISISCDKTPFKRGAHHRTAQAFKCNMPPPPLLHVNRESRDEALSVYKPHFKTSRSGSTYISARGHIYISFTRDTLRFEDTMLPYLAERELQGIQNLILDIKDSAYFGHFNMGIIARMRSLKTLEMWAEKGYGYGWSVADRYVTMLLGDFEEAMEIDPGWECPKVRIRNKDTGFVLGNIKGGALKPGWVEEPSKILEQQTDVMFHI